MIAHCGLERRGDPHLHERRELTGERLRALAAAVPQREPLQRPLGEHGAGGEPGKRARPHEQRLLLLFRREVLERQRHRGGRTQVGEVAVLLEQHLGRARLGVEQQEHAVAGGQPPLAVPVEPGCELEHDVRPAAQVRPLHVHLGPLLGQLHHKRIGERRLAQREGAEPPLHRPHRDREGDLFPERLERDDPHLSR